MIKKIIFIFTLFLFFLISFSVFPKDEIDQWQDTDKTYYDLIQEGFQVKAYNITNIEVQNDYIFMFFVTVLQKSNLVYECQEYQTLDANMQTLEMSFVCRQLVQPYQKGLGA